MSFFSSFNLASGGLLPCFCIPSLPWLLLFSRSVVSDSLRPHGLQHSRLPCPSPSPGACSNSCSLNRWCDPTISSTVVSLSSCLQSCPGSGSFPVSRLFTSGGQNVLSFSFSISPSNEYSGLISFRIDCFPIYWPWMIGLDAIILVFLNDLQWLESAFWDSGKVMEVGVYSLHTRKGDRRRPLKPLNSWSQEKLEEARGFSPRAPLSLRTSVVQNCERNLGGWGVRLNPHCLWSNLSWVGSLHPAFQKLPRCRV